MKYGPLRLTAPLAAAAMVAACASQPPPRQVPPPPPPVASPIPAPVQAPVAAEAVLNPIDARPMVDAIRSAAVTPADGSWRGTAVLRVRVDRSGQLLGCNMQNSSGTPQIDRAALQACSAAHFPAVPASVLDGSSSVAFDSAITFPLAAAAPLPPAGPAHTAAQLAMQRKLLLKSMNLVSTVFSADDEATYALFGADKNSPTARLLVTRLVALMADPVFQERIVADASDEEITQMFSSGAGESEKVGEVIGRRVFARSITSLPDDRQVGLLTTFTTIFETATPGECQGIMNQERGAGKDSMFTVMDRMPLQDRERVVSAIVDSVRMPKTPPPPPMTPEQKIQLYLPVQEYFAKLPKPQFVRLQKGLTDRTSPDHCWAIGQTMRGMIEGGPDIQVLAAHAMLAGMK